MQNLPYSVEDAQVQMTMSAIAYATSSSGGNPTTADLNAQLQKPDIATNKEWKVAWGPLTSSSYDNLIYVAQKIGHPVYSIVIRGTVFNSMDSWLGDFPTGQDLFNDYTGHQKTCVSNGFMDMFKDLLGDSVDGQSLQAYLTDLADKNKSDLTLYVTGHSQGAGLMPLFLAWVMTEAAGWDVTNLSCAGYGFAPPTAGCSDFASWMQDNAASYLIVNPNDIVPFGYAKVSDIRKQNVPVPVPEDITVDGHTVNLWDALDIAEAAVWKAKTWPWGCGSWAQAGKVITLPGEADPNTGDGYFAQVEVQHNHNSYLALLGANQTDISNKSPFTKQAC